MKLDDRIACGEMGRRHVANRNRNQIYEIEGEHVTLTQIAERAGISNHSMSRKMRTLRNDPSCITITWELLGIRKTA